METALYVGEEARPLPRPPPGKHKGFNASIFRNVTTWARSNYDLP